MADITQEDRNHPFLDTIYKKRFALPRVGTVAITVAADGGGGTTDFTAPGHGYQPGDPITQSGFITNTAYNASFIVNSVDGDNYNVTIAFGTTETGLTAFNSALATLNLYEGRALPGVAESAAEWQIRRNIYDAAGVLLGTNFAQGGNLETNGFHFAWSSKETFIYGV